MNTTSFFPFRSQLAQEEFQALISERARPWPVASETRWLETPSARTFMRVSGRPTDPPLVLLHGSRGNSLMWIPNITALSARYRTYALDTVTDTGLSIPLRKFTRMEHILGWLHEVLAELAPDGGLNLVGMSYGGGLACQYALRFPERLRKVVLLAPAVTVLPVSFGLIAHALLSLVPLAFFRRRFYYWLLQDIVKSGADGRAQVDQAVADWILADRCFRSLSTIALPVLKDKELQALKVPTKFLVGENEKIYSAREAVRRLNRVAPRIQTEIIPRAGHDLWIVQAELVTSRILAFLGEPG